MESRMGGRDASLGRWRWRVGKVFQVRVFDVAVLMRIFPNCADDLPNWMYFPTTDTYIRRMQLKRDLSLKNVWVISVKKFIVAVKTVRRVCTSVLYDVLT